MLSLTASMRYKYCEGNVSFRYKWDAMISYIRYVLREDPWSGTVFIFMNRRHNQLRVFYYERGGFVIDVKKQTYSICWADLVSLLEDKQIRRLYLREAV